MRFTSLLRLSAALFATFLCAAGAEGEAPKAALLKSGLPGERPEFLDALRARLTDAGYGVSELGMADLCDAARLSGVDLLVLPNAADLPAYSAGPIEGFLERGGDIIALNAPLWQHQLLEDGDAWVDREEYARRHATALLEHVLFDFAPGSIANWQRTTNDPSISATYETASGQPASIANALHVTLSKLTSWDTFLTPPLERPFPERHTLTVFYAKGGPRTTELAIEWTEKDGSRWIATVPLSDQWRPYVLEPKDFHFWESVPGRANDAFRPENAARMSVGLAFSHTRVGGGPHEYRVGPFGTAERTPEHEKMLTTVKLPALDTLCPGYKFFPANGVANLRVREDQAVLTPAALPVPAVVFAPHPRPRAGGFDKGRAWRWMPLIETTTADGDWRGTPATLMLHVDGPYKGGAWASFAVRDPAWYQTPAVLNAIGPIAQRMRDGLFLVDAGTNFYTYFEGQPVTLGVRAANLGSAEKRPVARVTLSDAATGQPFHAKEWDLTIAPGAVTRVAEDFKPNAWPDAGFSVTAELLEDGVVIDRALHDAHVWKPKPQKSFITVKDGDFVLEGKRWRAHGVNYMPSSGIGTEDGEYFEYWVGARSYDPEVIERDLRHIKALGMNAVSIFIHRASMEAQNLLDLLRRIDALGLKANLSLRPGTPMDQPGPWPDWPAIREMIEYYHLGVQNCIFALDLAWEPMFGNHDARRQWDSRWREWIVERYGSIENAEADWGFPAPRDESGQVTNPLGNQTAQDGDWRKMTAAYRRFLDTLLYEKYSYACRMVGSVDPIHPVSFRMAEAGNPTFHWDGAIPYDFPYLAGAVGILEPEAYGRIGDWERVKPGWFEFEYARWAGPKRPMVWAEAGVSAWLEARMEAPPEALQFQADLYTQLYRMLIASGADGIFFWWYPGGYRTGECSDYGIINPDGSDRPVTRVIRENAQAFLDGPSERPVTEWIEINRDLHPDAVAGIYDAVKDAFWAAIDAGRVPGLKTAGTGTNSADCQLIAVGDSPYNGKNPPKYLDGFLDGVEIRDAAGAWRPVERGASVQVGTAAPVMARVTVTNLGEASWVAAAPPQTPGGVFLVAQAGKAASQTNECRTPMRAPVPRFGSLMLQDVVLLPEAPREPTEVTLTFWAGGRAYFGPRYTITVSP